MTNQQLRAALADGRVHSCRDLAPHFGVSVREIRHRATALRNASAGPLIEDVWTSGGAGYRMRDRPARPRVLSLR